MIGDTSSAGAIKMHDIPMTEVSEDFAAAWQAAGRHIEKSAGGKLDSWLRAHLSPPFLEHLSFRLGNQLFFIRIEDEDDRTIGPGSLQGLLSVAEGQNGYACLMPMRKRDGQWQPAVSGWGLQDARDHTLIHPPAEISDQKIEMTDWELQDFAVQLVRKDIENSGHELMSWQSNPSVDPSIWFNGNDGPEWVIVKATRYPQKDADLPKNWRSVADNCSHMSKRGSFASVGVACMQTINTDGKLYRGYPLVSNYAGLKSIHKISR
jgi:hypothetical protein